MPATITREELNRKLERGETFSLVETLPAEKFRAGHIRGAINLPPGQVKRLAPDLLPDKGAEIVVYCAAYT